MNSPAPQRLPRRTVLQWFAAAAVTWPLTASAAPPASRPVLVPGQGYGPDPDLSRFYEPGDVWPLTFTPQQRAAVLALADLILPADHLGPAASTVRVPEMLDEWISAPYALQQKDRDIILPGLQWLDAEAGRRFQQTFAALSEKQQRAIADDICYPPDAQPAFKTAATFFQKFRSLAASAYYGTEAGWKALGYVGNVPSVNFEGPPPEVLQRLGVTQTVA